MLKRIPGKENRHYSKPRAEYSNSRSFKAGNANSKSNNTHRIKSKIIKPNPKQRNGKPSECVVCGDPNHWSYDCPEGDGHHKKKMSRASRVYHGETSNDNYDRSVQIVYSDNEDYDWDEKAHPDYDEETYYVWLTENNFKN